MVDAVNVRTVEGDGGAGGVTTSSALAAAAMSPACEPTAHSMPAEKHHTATTPTNTMPYAAVNAPTQTATPSSSDTATTSGTRRNGVSCNAAAPAIAPAPAANIAAAGEPTYRATAAIARTPSRLRATAPASGELVNRRALIRALPLITCLFSPRAAHWRRRHG